MTQGMPGARRERQQRHTAELIQRHHPAWLIMYGPWSRKFWAFSILPALPGRAVILSTADPRDLTTQIRDAENAVTRPVTRPPRQQEQGHPMTLSATPGQTGTHP